MSETNYSIEDLKDIYLIHREGDNIAYKSEQSIKFSIQRFEDFLGQKELTISDFDKGSNLVVKIEGKRTNKATPRNLFDYFVMWMVNEAKYAPSTIDTTYGYFNGFVKFLYEEDHITYPAHEHTAIADYINHGETIQRELWGEDYVSITPEQHKIVRENVPPPVFRNKLICDLLMTTGMRRGELAELRLDNIDIDNNRVEVPAIKGRTKPRPVYIPDKVKTNLNIWIEAKRDAYYNSDSDYLFVTNDSRSNGGISPKRISKIVQIGAEALEDQDSYLDQSGKKKNKYKAHSYRNGYADHFIEKSSSNGGTDRDANIYLLSQILGHSSISQTEKYLSDTNEEVIKDQMDKYSPSV